MMMVMVVVDQPICQRNMLKWHVLTPNTCLKELKRSRRGWKEPVEMRLLLKDVCLLRQRIDSPQSYHRPYYYHNIIVYNTEASHICDRCFCFDIDQVPYKFRCWCWCWCWCIVPPKRIITNALLHSRDVCLEIVAGMQTAKESLRTVLLE